MVKGYKTKSEKGKVSDMNTRGNQAQASKNSSPGKSHWVYLIPSARNSDSILKACLLRSSLVTQCSGILLVANHINILCLAHIKIVDCQKKSRISA
jgi:hypothetical protein